MSDQLSSRIAGVYRSSDGDTVNAFDNKHVRRFDTYALRDITRWTPTSAQTWSLNLHAARYDGDGPRYHYIPVNNGAFPESVLPLIGVTPPYTEKGGWWSGSWDLPQAERVDNVGGSVSGVIDFGFASLTSISAYETVNAYVRYDSDASPLDYVDVVYADKSWMASQELRLASTGQSPLSWIAGAYFYRDFITSNNTFDIAEFARSLFNEPPNPNDPSAPANYVQHWSQPTHSFAVFGSTTYQISNAWKATAGLRWTQDHKSIDYHTFQYEPTTIGTVPLIDVNLENSWHDITESASIEYAFSRQAMVYASFNRGFKAGAYNGSPIFDPSTVRAVNPEHVNAFELGTKTQWFDDRLMINLAAFYNDYKDLQVFRFVPDPVTGVPTAFLDNAAAAKIKGVEVELHARPARALDIELGASYLNARYENYTVQQADSVAGTPAISYSGNRLVGAPALHGNGAIEYGIDLSSTFRLVPRGEFVHNSTIYFDSSNNAILSQAGYSLVNFALRLEDIRRNYDISAWVRNATNRHYSTDALDLSNFGLDIAVHGDPRTYGVSINYRFE